MHRPEGQSSPETRNTLLFIENSPTASLASAVSEIALASSALQSEPPRRNRFIGAGLGAGKAGVFSAECGLQVGSFLGGAQISIRDCKMLLYKRFQAPANPQAKLEYQAHTSEKVVGVNVRSRPTVAHIEKQR